MKFDPYDHTQTKIPEDILTEWMVYLEEMDIPLPSHDPPLLSLGLSDDIVLLPINRYTTLLEAVFEHEQQKQDQEFRLTLNFNRKGNVLSRRWTSGYYGEQHREHLPAQIRYDLEGNITQINFFQLCGDRHKELTFWGTYDLAPDEMKENLLRNWLPLVKS